MLWRLRQSVKRVLHKRRRRAEIKATRPTVSTERIVEDIEALPVDAGAVVLVHSSLKAIGFVDGGAEAVVEALIGGIVDGKQGTVMLPTYSIEGGSMWETLLADRVFDVATTASNLGAIPEAFRRHAQAVRSVHPTHSFSAVGPDANWLIETHHKCSSSFGPGSPMAKLAEKDGYLLGLGTNLGRVTFYHCLEEIEDDFPIDVYSSDSPITVRCMGHAGESIEMTLLAHDTGVSKTRIDKAENSDIREFYTKRFEEQAGMTWHQIGEARCWLIRARAMYDECVHLMKRGITIYSTRQDIEKFEATTSQPDALR